ncbi:NADH-ubiquinone oxidoreductase-F iron-sulfur binding region domain-containing protein [Gemmata sp. JC717]|uniref:NAD(P)H-dependent oxidoreductase subunit E n=1 Tax=Gemmata algarum TaxID=2975278 RepID=UPI0021BB7E35|nr:NAD(P)H-dependent oxidoreductase subunit E [Gemmata algarum]MDY3551901.1 NADH-ubiquinone oxidoreductase-F iron-sulfur binding region domain-containing protein [Gemmata algarum]
MIVQRLRDIQNRFGFLPDKELRALAHEINVPLYRIEEVSSFFPAFKLERTNPPEIEMRVCRDLTCHHRGAAALLDERTGLPVLAAELSEATGKSVCVEGVSCLGRCDRAPAVWVEKRPMPEHVHAWVYAGRDGEFLEGVLRDLAEDRDPPEPDTDAAYEPYTNTNRGYAIPKGVPVDPEHPAPRTAGWSLDIYGRQGWPRDYRAVKRFTDYLARLIRPLVPPPRELGGKDLETYVQRFHPLLWELKTANLLGMGGAGAPAYQKWLDVWQQPGNEKYIVCNGDESEPGTFKDREILLRMPHLVVEGVILAGLMTGATSGHIYVRHEYFEQIHALKEEIKRAQELGACGPNIFGSGRNFPVEVFESPGGYICGEQSALIEAMEDRRGQPRNRPPELSANGFRDKPTVVNNVETLAWAPGIVLFGGDKYEMGGWRLATDPKIKFGGRRLFSVSGDVARPGVYEVAIGLTLGELFNGDKYCGGITGPLRAVAASGPSGGLVPAKLPVDPKFDAKKRADAVARIRDRSAQDADFMEWFLNTHLPLGATELDVLKIPLDLNFFRHLNGALRLPVEAMLGAAITVYAGDVDVLDQAVNYTQFYRNESCGKCVPCRLGSQKLVQIGEGLLKSRRAGRLPADDLAAIKKDVKEITKTLQLTSICGLGYVAPIPLATALEYFVDDAPKANGRKPAE